MQCLQSHGLQRVFLRTPSTSITFFRDASLTSAISRGIRRGSNTLERLGTSPRNSNPTVRKDAPPRSRFEIERLEQPRKPRLNKWEKEREARSLVSTEAPFGIPYTTAGSEFLYGTFAVKAALEAKRRQLHKLYVWKGDQQVGDNYDVSIPKLARAQRIAVQEVAGTWDKMLLRMSGQRPHNGFILEASPIPKLPVTTLGKMEQSGSAVTATVPPQSAETQMANKIFESSGSIATIPRLSERNRYPLLLWLDRITDTGNLGAIIRTACFFGVDAVLIPEHGTAPFGPVTVKASAGSAEYLPVLTVKKELEFLRASQENGWKFFAAAAPESASTKHSTVETQANSMANELDNNPCVLMVGNEGEGLRAFMQRAADASIGVEGVQTSSKVIDSLNVSVAAALLISRFIVPIPKSSVVSVNSDQEHGTLDRTQSEKAS